MDKKTEAEAELVHYGFQLPVNHRDWYQYCARAKDRDTLGNVIRYLLEKRYGRPEEWILERKKPE